MIWFLLLACTDRTLTRSPPPRGFDLHGIDVSHHQGWIDWPAVSEAGVDFAFLKATEGMTHVDRRFEDNWERATVPVGAYHYFSACHGGAAQAAHFLTVVPEAGGLPSVLDVEVDGRCNRGTALDGLAVEVEIWLDVVEEAQGLRPLIYGSRVLLDTRLGEVEADRWVASYSRRPAQRFRVWQYTSAGRVPGVAGPVDRNVATGLTLRER